MGIVNPTAHCSVQQCPGHEVTKPTTHPRAYVHTACAHAFILVDAVLRNGKFLVGKPRIGCQAWELVTVPLTDLNTVQNTQGTKNPGVGGWGKKIGYA